MEGCSSPGSSSSTTKSHRNIKEAARARTQGVRRGEIDRYTCLTCFRVFATGQALGGHQNRHRREREDLIPFAPPVFAPPPMMRWMRSSEPSRPLGVARGVLRRYPLRPVHQYLPSRRYMAWRSMVGRSRAMQPVNIGLAIGVNRPVERGSGLVQVVNQAVGRGYEPVQEVNQPVGRELRPVQSMNRPVESRLEPIIQDVNQHVGRDMVPVQELNRFEGKGMVPVRDLRERVLEPRQDLNRHVNQMDLEAAQEPNHPLGRAKGPLQDLNLAVERALGPVVRPMLPPNAPNRSVVRAQGFVQDINHHLVERLIPDLNYPVISHLLLHAGESNGGTSVVNFSDSVVTCPEPRASPGVSVTDTGGVGANHMLLGLDLNL